MEKFRGWKLKKKRIVVISSLVVLVGLIFLLAFTVFSLKTVEIDFRTSKQYISATNKEIVKSGDFDMGKSVLVHDKKQYIENLESFDPYIKVINIETKFPSTFVVHIAERQEVYAVPFQYGHYICDEELRVLRISYSYTSSTDNAILLIQEGVNVEDNLKEGDYIQNMRDPAIYSALYGQNRPLGEQQELIEKIVLSTEYDSRIKKNQTVTTLKYYSGQTFKIINDSYGLKYKTKLMNDVYAQLFDFVGKTITDSEDNEILLTEENLKDCIVIINNYYNYKQHKESECWFDLIIK